MQLKKSTSIVSILLLLFVVIASMKSAMAVTWSINMNRFTDHAYYDGFPAITQTRDGKTWLVWSKSILGDLSLRYKTSTDLGNTWSEEMNLTEPLTPGNNQNPSIIQAINGTIWVVWASDRPLPPSPTLPDFNLTADPESLAISQGGSDNSTITVTSISNFSQPVLFSVSILNETSGVTATLNQTQVTPPPNGTTNSTLTVSVEATTTPGNDTVRLIGIGGKVMHIVDIALEIAGTGGSGGLGESAPAYKPSSPPESIIEDYELYYKTSNDDGATWSNDTLLTNNNFDDLCPSIFQLNNGTIFMVWQSLESGNQDIYYKTTLDGTDWSNTTQLTTFSGHDRAPSVTQTMDGTIWITWSTNRTGDNEIFYTTYDGFSWSESTRLTYNTEDSDLTPRILQTIDGNIWIFWCCMPPAGGADIYYKYYNGITWSERIQFTTDGNEDMWPSITQTSETKMWVTWVTNRDDQPDGNWEIYYRTSLAGDVNEDGIVDIADLSLVGIAYGSFEGEPQYNPDADINKDGIIDIWDITIVCIYYGET